MSEGGKNKGSLKSDTLNTPERTDTKLAEVAGVGKDTIRNTETILTKGTPEDIQQVREGKASISGKAKENMREGGKGSDKLPKV